MNRLTVLSGTGALTASVLLTLGACSNQSPTPAQAASAPSSSQAAACGPPYYAAVPRTIGGPVVRTGQMGVSPPARSLPPTTAAAPGSKRVMPIHRLPPASERCPPVQTPVPHS